MPERDADQKETWMPWMSTLYRSSHLNKKRKENYAEKENASSARSKAIWRKTVQRRNKILTSRQPKYAPLAKQKTRKPTRTAQQPSSEH
jgi:hypothetical protein